MERIQVEKVPANPITELLEKLSSELANLSNSNFNHLSEAVPSTSGRVSYGRMPTNKIPNIEKNLKNEEQDSLKKKNRRRERHSKNKLMNEGDINPSTSSTPSSSSSTSKHGAFSPQRSLIQKTAKKSNHNHSVSPPSTVDHTPKKESEPKGTPLDNSLEHVSVQKYIFKIWPVKTAHNSYLFRKRSGIHKYINLKSFAKNSRPCIFETSILFLNSALKNLSLTKLSKNKWNKYPCEIEHRRFEQSSSSSSSVTENLIISEDSNQQDETSRSFKEDEIITLEDILLFKNRGVRIKQEINQGLPSQTAPPKKSRRPKKEKHKQNKILKKQVTSSLQKFPEYITEQEVNEGLKHGELFKGALRVNPKNARVSYVSNEDTSLADYYITSVADRNRALDGDVVVLLIKPEEEWSEGKKTATVVYILEKVHPRMTVGILKPMEGKPDFAAFYPRDKRMPIMHIPTVSLPHGYKANPKLFQNILVVAKLLEWSKPLMALGAVTETLGLSGDLRVETLSILKEFCLDITPFSAEMVEDLPKSKEIPEKEFCYREDIRKECIFTIDPLTARDLDDAVSVKELPNGHYEIGVHISDASYYLEEGTSLDQMVSKKGTTIYLVDNVYHMLPVELCLHCSLLPGEDKLAFSVFWELNEQGEIFNTRFARTILNSCTQLAYEHAQQMIENPEKEFEKDELPQIYNGFTAKDLSKTVNVLQNIAINLRDARIKNGSLRMDKIKLLFSLNPRNGEPLDFIIYENKESHRLIEEFMLLANISVATKIHESFPDLAFLRCHEAPKATMMMEAQKCLETCGIHIDISSSRSLYSSLRKYISDDYQGLCRGIVLNHIFSKPMTRARYFCSATMEDEADIAHYALSVPIYTHFTSPIRRYADIMVHRLLAASLGYADEPNWNVDQVCAIAANCNEQKYNAKRAGEASGDLYLSHYIDKHQPYIQDCVVIDVRDRSFDVIVLKTGSNVRIYQKRCEDDPSWKVEAIPSSTIEPDKKEEHEKKVLRQIIKFPITMENPDEHTMVVEMFSVVKVKLTKVPNSYKLEAFLMRPIVSRTFERSNSHSSKSPK